MRVKRKISGRALRTRIAIWFASDTDANKKRKEKRGIAKETPSSPFLKGEACVQPESGVLVRRKRRAS